MKINSSEIKNLNPINTIAISHIGAYAGIAGAFEKLAAWAGANNLWAASPRMAGVYHDDPMQTPAEKLRSDACLEDISGIELFAFFQRQQIEFFLYKILDSLYVVVGYTLDLFDPCSIFQRKVRINLSQIFFKRWRYGGIQLG